MSGETSLSFGFDLTNSGIIKELTNTKTSKFQMGVDYGNGDIQTIGRFELLPNKITNYKRKKKGKRYIIYKYELTGYLYFAGRYVNE